MANWVNADGLSIDLGITEATSVNPKYFQAGEYKTYGPVRTDEFTIDLTQLPAFGTAGILNNRTFFGKGWVPERVEIETLVAVTGTGATLSLGLIQNSDRTTVISATALTTAALTQTLMAAVGTRLDIVAGSTAAGANIGVATTLDALVQATVGTANFTQGRIKLRIDWRPTVNI